MASTATRDARSGHAGGRGKRVDAGSALLLAAGMACFGSATPVSRIVGRSFPVWLGSGLRMAVAAAVLVPVLGVVRRGAPTSLTDRLRALDRQDRVLLARRSGRSGSAS